MSIIAVVALAVATVACDAAPATWTEPSTGMVFVEITAGRFVMGSPPDEQKREAQETPHDVTISRPFWMGKFEVTQRQWERVMGRNPSWFAASGPDFPVERVSYYDIRDFLNRISARSPGNRFRLPSEAEWEYACRAGTRTPFSVGTDLTRTEANIGDRVPSEAQKREGQTMRVGSFPANAWGLHDMHGNVWEWTEDDHCPYPTTPVTDPVARCGSPLKVIRGGSWYFEQDSARCALRYTHRPVDVGFSVGLRIVREALH
jgi:formylglycine-generating enzyme required for sulfatase activity